MTPDSIDPTLPFTVITIDGKDYKMCFDYEALAVAEEKLLAAGHDANLLFRAPPFTFGNVRILFAVSLLAYQPDTDFTAAKRLVNYSNRGEILAAVMKAWGISMPEPEENTEGSEESPTQPE